jgi:hypothetical protein
MANISKENRNNLDIILKDVFSVDTEAGYKLRYMITKALACPKFREKINLLPQALRVDQLMYWIETSDGQDYWAYIHRLIQGRG